MDGGLRRQRRQCPLSARGLSQHYERYIESQQPKMCIKFASAHDSLAPRSFQEHQERVSDQLDFRPSAYDDGQQQQLLAITMATAQAKPDDLALNDMACPKFDGESSSCTTEAAGSSTNASSCVVHELKRQSTAGRPHGSVQDVAEGTTGDSLMFLESPLSMVSFDEGDLGSECHSLLCGEEAFSLGTPDNSITCALEGFARESPESCRSFNYDAKGNITTFRGSKGCKTNKSIKSSCVTSGMCTITGGLRSPYERAKATTCQNKHAPSSTPLAHEYCGKPAIACSRARPISPGQPMGKNKSFRAFTTCFNVSHTDAKQESSTKAQRRKRKCSLDSVVFDIVPIPKVLPGSLLEKRRNRSCRTPHCTNRYRTPGYLCEACGGGRCQARGCERLHQGKQGLSNLFFCRAHRNIYARLQKEGKGGEEKKLK